jgi:hypothetical protein
VGLYWEQARIVAGWKWKIQDYEGHRVFRGDGQGLQTANASSAINLIILISTPQGLTDPFHSPPIRRGSYYSWINV